ncbi:MAG: ABC transporter ATP-binding protein [Acidobacteria bacterium]|nr:ABC transporter ATP-binding protein [Acidobacteriota bacterium]
MTAPAAVVARGLSKSYRKWGRTRAFGTLKSALLGRGFGAALAPSEVVQALSDVSFTVARGETFGVVGPNGCGKSTLLKLVAGLFKPTAGTLAVTGKVSALIELGAGFHPEISGRENVVINGVMLGLTRKEIERKLPEIVAFSGLEEFIDEPVKTYSSGMYVRLGFAVAVHVDPDVLVVDEVLAVGDEAFAHRCLDTIADFSRRGKTIFFVSHSLALVEELCDRVLYLDHGRTKALGDPRETLARYRMDVADEEGARLAKEHKEEEKIFLEGEEGEGRAASAAHGGEAAPHRGETHTFEEIPPSPSPVPVEKPRRWGSREVEITGCRMLDASGAERYAFRSGESVTFEIAVTPRAPLSDFVFGIGIFTPEDVCVHGTNTELDGFLPSKLDGPAFARVTLHTLDLGTGTYLVDVAVHSRREAPYDYWRGACRFQVDSPDRSAGLWRAARNWSFSGPLSLRKTRDRK